MRMVVLAIGKKHDNDIALAIDDYSARLKRYGSFDWHIVSPARGRMGSDETKRVEAAAIASFIKDDDYIILLDEGGIQLTSNELASILDELDMQSAKRIVVIIGGAYGVTDELRSRADIVWSLSRLVFPHQLVRLIIAEQFYRANTIRRGEPYHHE